MPTVFPAAPTVNQNYTAGGVTWKWTGSVWQAKRGTVNGLLDHSHLYDGSVSGIQTTIAIAYPNLDGGSVYNIISAIGNVDGGFPESFYSLEAAYDGGVI